MYTPKCENGVLKNLVGTCELHEVLAGITSCSTKKSKGANSQWSAHCAGGM